MSDPFPFFKDRRCKFISKFIWNSFQYINFVIVAKCSTQTFVCHFSLFMFSPKFRKLLFVYDLKDAILFFYPLDNVFMLLMIQKLQ